MKIYIDIIIFINFFFDFILLLSVSKLLKRNANIIRLFLGSLIGSLSIICLFIPFSSLMLFIFKIIVSLFMILISFGYKNIKYLLNNMSYLYLCSIVLGGFLYFVNNSFSYKNIGLTFIHNSYSINLILIMFLAPIMIFWYVKKERKIKNEYNNYYEVEITFLNGKKRLLTGFLDTGNNLYDPYKKRPIILINKEVIKDYNPRCILVPCMTINKTSMMKCFKAKDIYINNKKIKTPYLIGISDNNFDIDGVDLLLHKKIIKGDEFND